MSRTGQALLVAMVAVLGVAAGCAKPYINIPPQRGDIASHDPNDLNVRGAEIAALRAVLLDRPIQGPIQIILPEGTDTLTYAAVLPQVSESALAPHEPGAEDAYAILKLEQVRIRGWEGEVDITRPWLGDRRQLVTVYLKYAPFSGWTFQRIRTWRGNPDEVLPGPGMEPAPVESP